jgi:hypothetical protein
MDDNGRSTAYADLLSALLALRADPATARFDAELAAAEAAGLVDGSVARTLRWWQRESMRGLADHLAAVLPDLLTELLESDRAAAETVRAAQSSWAEATAALPAGAALPSTAATTPPAPLPAPPAGPAPVATQPPVPPAVPHLRPVDDIDDAHSWSPGAIGRPPLRKAPPVPPGSAPVDVAIVAPREPLRPGFAPHRPVSPSPTAPTASSAARSAAGDAVDGAVDGAAVRPPDTAAPPVPAVTDETVIDATAAVDPPATPTGAPRTRLLVAGLTVLADSVSDTADGTGSVEAPAEADRSAQEPVDDA